MQRIKALLKKTEALANDDAAIIDIDLMMEYTRSLYAELLELRERATSKAAEPAVVPEMPLTLPEENAEDATISGEEKPVIQETAIAEQPVPEVVETSDRPAAQPAAYQPRPDADIRKHIGINDKYLFISELFNNNKETYELVMTRINGFATYEEAIDWLDEQIHEEHHWTDDNDTVQSFYGILSQFFASR